VGSYVRIARCLCAAEHLVSFGFTLTLALALTQLVLLTSVVVTETLQLTL